jgi:hypothetical protein
VSGLFKLEIIYKIDIAFAVLAETKWCSESKCDCRMPGKQKLIVLRIEIVKR